MKITYIFSPVDIGHWVETIPESVDDFSVWTGEHGSVLLAKGRASQEDGGSDIQGEFCAVIQKSSCTREVSSQEHRLKKTKQGKVAFRSSARLYFVSLIFKLFFHEQCISLFLTLSNSLCILLSLFFVVMPALMHGFLSFIHCSFESVRCDTDGEGGILNALPQCPRTLCDGCAV